MVLPKGYVDFPCFDMDGGTCLEVHPGMATREPPAQDLSQARMVLCISAYPRGFRGGGTIAQGPEWSDTWTGHGIRLERRDEVLVVEGRPVATGGSDSQLDVNLSWNPWLLTSVRTTVANRGVYSCLTDLGSGEKQALDALYVYGSVSEGWVPNPLGLVLLAVGIWLLVRGHRARRRGKQSRTQEDLA
jgi:hypothetical protein